MKTIQIFLGIFLLSDLGQTEESHSRYYRQSNPQINPRGPPPAQQQYHGPADQPQQQFRPPPPSPPLGQYQPPNVQPPQQGQQQLGNPNQRQLPPGMRWPSDNQQPGQNVAQMPEQQHPAAMRLPPDNQPRGPNIAQLPEQQQPMGLGQPSSQEVLEGVYRLSEEIVEAVVERLEEDEAMALEMERQGFDPDVYSNEFLTKPTLLLIASLSILLLLQM